MLIEIKNCNDLTNIGMALGLAADNAGRGTVTRRMYNATLGRFLEAQREADIEVGLKQRDPDTGAFDPPVIDD